MDGVVNSDISRADGVKRNPEIAKLILRSYSRHQGTSVSIATICEDIKAKDWNDEQIAAIRQAVGKYRLEGELRSEIQLNIKRL